MVRVREQTVDDVVRQVRDALMPDKLAQLDKIAGHLVDAETQAQFRAFLRAIRGRSTATFYVNTTKLKQSSKGVTLSVRVSGVECGEVMLTKSSPDRTFTPKHIEKHFTGCWTTSKTRLPWEHPEVRCYLQLASRKALQGELADHECGVEAALIQELRDGNLRHNAPILFPTKFGVPYQFPVPITANGGVQAAGGRQAGHIDILSRHGKGRTSRLRILELKKPDAADAAHALDQAVAYAAALHALLARNSNYRMLFGYPQYTPQLEATAVVADDGAIRRDIAAARNRLAKCRGSLDVRLSALFYQWENTPGGRRLRITHQID